MHGYRCPASFLLLVCCTASGQDWLPPVPTGPVQVTYETFATGLPVAGSFNVGGPTDLTQIPNGTGNIAVSNFGGQIHLFDGSGNQFGSDLIDLSDPGSPTYSPDFAVLDANGLVSVAFHPDFADSSMGGFGKFYTLEAENDGVGIPDFAGSVIDPATQPHRQVLYEYTLASDTDTMCDTICAATKRQIFRVAQPGWHHNMGDLLFAEDRTLLISSGDGNVTGNGSPQMSDNATLLSNVFGKILRIDPLGSNSANGQYGVPDDNPFVGSLGVVEEIYAYGLRNPYRLAFDQASGELYASEVGKRDIESVERIVRGGNHGWNLKEGSFLYDKFTQTISEDFDSDGDGIGDVAGANNLVEPLFQYDRDDGVSVIGGEVHTGDIAGLQGKYVFADFLSRMFYGDPTTGQMFAFPVSATGDPLPSRIWSVNQDNNGDIYVLGRVSDGAGGFAGHIVKMRAAIDGDFNEDGSFDCADVDALVGEIAGAGTNPAFDLTNDGQVDVADLDEWLAQGGAANPTVTGGNPFLYGDANLDGTVDGADFIIWNANKFTSAPEWCRADFNADGIIDGPDFIAWNANKFMSSDFETNPVPEPAGLGFVMGLLACGIRRGQDRL